MFEGEITAISPQSSGQGAYAVTGIEAKGFMSKLANVNVSIPAYLEQTRRSNMIVDALNAAGVPSERQSVSETVLGDQHFTPAYNGDALARLKQLDALTLGNMYESAAGAVVSETAAQRTAKVLSANFSDSQSTPGLSIDSASVTVRGDAGYNLFKGKLDIYYKDSTVERRTAEPEYPIKLLPNVPTVIQLGLDESQQGLAAVETWSSHTHQAWSDFDEGSMAGSGTNLTAKVGRSETTTANGVTYTLTYQHQPSDPAAVYLTQLESSSSSAAFLGSTRELKYPPNLTTPEKPFPYEYNLSFIVDNESAVATTNPATTEFDAWASAASARYGASSPLVEIGFESFADDLTSVLLGVEIGDLISIALDGESKLGLTGSFNVEKVRMTAGEHGEISGRIWAAQTYTGTGGVPQPPPPDVITIPLLPSVDITNVTHNSYTATWTAAVGALTYEYRNRKIGDPLPSWTNAGTTVSATIIGLEPETDYEFNVRGVNNAGSGFIAAARVATLAAPVPQTAPGHVVNLRTHDVDTDSFQCSWKAPSGVVLRYDARIRATGGNWGAWASTGAGAINNKTFEGLQEGITYEVEVRAVNSSSQPGEVRLIQQRTEVTPTVAPPSPGAGTLNVRSTDIEDDSITFTWSFVDLSGTVQYRYKKLVGGTFTSWANVASNATSHTLTGLDSSVAYVIQARIGTGDPVGIEVVTRTDRTAARLTALTANISGTTTDVPLSPTFAAGTYAYEGTVDNSATAIEFTHTFETAGSTATYTDKDGTAVTSPYALSVGENEIRVEVSKSDLATATYSVKVTRAAALDTVTNPSLTALSLSAGTLSPAFAADTYNYNATVGANVSSVIVTATAPDGQTVSGAGTKTLVAGNNNVDVRVVSGGSHVKIPHQHHSRHQRSRHIHPCSAEAFVDRHLFQGREQGHRRILSERAQRHLVGRHYHVGRGRDICQSLCAVHRGARHVEGHCSQRMGFVGRQQHHIRTCLQHGDSRLCQIHPHKRRQQGHIASRGQRQPCQHLV